MNNYSVSYEIEKDGIVKKFNSEKDACDFLGVKHCTVSSCFSKNLKCKGWIIRRGEITTHHSTNTRLFKIWGGMKERCYREKHPHYKNYGGRGIIICDEWLDFNNFKKWSTSNGYNDDFTIDRIDVNGNYEPSNCRWVSMKEQLNNTTRSHYVYVNGEKLTVAQCSEKYHIPKSTVIWREKHNRDIITGAKMDKKEATYIKDIFMTR